MGKTKIVIPEPDLPDPDEMKERERQRRRRADMMARGLIAQIPSRATRQTLVRPDIVNPQ